MPHQVKEWQSPFCFGNWFLGASLSGSQAAPMDQTKRVIYELSVRDVIAQTGLTDHEPGPQSVTTFGP